MNKTTKILISAVIIILIIWLITVRSGTTQSDTVKIGVLAPLTGIVADFGEETRKAVQSVDIEGVEFVFEDEKCEPKEAVSAFKKLTEFDGIKFIIGPGCGSPQEAITPLLAGKNIVAVVTSAATEDLYQQSGGNLFNVQYSLENESKFIAEKMLERGHKKVVLIGYKNAFSEAHIQSFKKHFKGEVAKEIWFIDNAADVSTELLKIRGLEFDAMYSPDIAFFFANGNEKLQQLKITQHLFSSYVVELPIVRKFVDGVMYSFPSDLPDGTGAVYGLSKQAAEILGRAVRKCDSDYMCVKKKLDDQFKNGVMNREIILKQIKNGEPEIL